MHPHTTVMNFSFTGLAHHACSTVRMRRLECDWLPGQGSRVTSRDVVMINWILAIVVLLMLALILMIASSAIPAGVIWFLILLLAVIIGRTGARRWIENRRKR